MKVRLQREKGRNRASGYTLVEVMIVASIISMLMAIAVPGYMNVQWRAKDAQVRAQLQMLRAARNQAEKDTGCVILHPQWLTNSASNPPALCYNVGPSGSGYSQSIPTGTWHGPYVTDAAITNYTGWPGYAPTGEAGIFVTYNWPPTTGDFYQLTSSNPTASDGTLYSTW